MPRFCHRVCAPCLVVIAQDVFLLECGQYTQADRHTYTQKVTDATYPSPTHTVTNWMQDIISHDQLAAMRKAEVLG